MAEIPITSPKDDPVLDEIGGWQFHIFADPEGGGGIPLLISRAATWALIAAGVFLFLCVLISGIQMMSSNVSKVGMQAARQRLTNCLIGLSIIALAWAVVLVVETFFGLDLFG